MPHSAPSAPYVYKIDIVYCEKFIKSNFIHILMENNSFHNYIWAAYFFFFFFFLGGGGGGGGGVQITSSFACVLRNLSPTIISLKYRFDWMLRGCLLKKTKKYQVYHGMN